LGTRGAYLDAIAEQTKDVDVQLVFNNAGYLVTGFFDRTCAERAFTEQPDARAATCSATWPTWSATR
jgi:hypothetical protein